MRKFTIALLTGGLLMSAAAGASAQDLATAVPVPKSEFMVFADKGATLSPTALATIRGVAQQAKSARQVTLTGRAEDAVEGAAVFQAGSRADGGDRPPVNDNAPVRDQGLGAQAYDRVPCHQVTGHRMRLPPPVDSPGRCRAQPDDGTTIRSRTRRNAALASRSTFCSSTVVS